MVSSHSHFSHAVGLKDKDGLCSEGLIDQNNCASICLLEAEQTTASHELYFHQLSQPLMSLTWVVRILCMQYTNSGLEAYGKDVLKLHCPKKSTIIYTSGEAE